MPASLKHLTNKKLNLTSLLARWNDGLYYTAAIVRCDKTNKRCLVCFEDGSEVWVNNRDVHLQLSLDQLNEDEDIVCCICDVGDSEPPNEIILCDVCQQGYHQKCHNPPVDSSKIDESEDTNDHKDWFCATCSYILNQSNRAKLSATVQQQQQQKEQEVSQKQEQTSLKQEPIQSKQVTVRSQPLQSASPQPQRQPAQPKTRTPEPQQASPPNPTSSTQSTEPSSKQPSAQKQIPAKSAKLSSSPQPTHKTTTVPIVKTTTSPVPKPAPYYPLSNQARAVASSSTAALATMTASSALVVGSSAGRTKQDLVNQSNKSSQRQRSSGGKTETISTPVKHAVRKSSVNFVIPVKQSALPTATRSVLPSLVPPAKVPRLMLATSSPVAQQQIVVPQATLVATPPQSTTSIIESSNSSSKSPIVKERQPHTSLQPTVNLNGTSSTSSISNISPTSSSPPVKSSTKMSNILTKDMSPSNSTCSSYATTTKTPVNDNKSNNNLPAVVVDTSNESRSKDFTASSVSIETVPK